MRVMLTTKADPSTYVVGDIPRVEAPGAIARDGHVYVLDPGYNALNAIDGAEARYFRATVFVAGGAVTLFEGHA